MKSYKTLILSAALGLMLCACDDDSSSTAPVDETKSSSSVQKTAKSSSSVKKENKSSSSAKKDAKSSSSVKSSSSSKKDDKSSSSAKEEQKYVISFMMDASQFVGITTLSADQSKVVKNFVEAPNSGSIAYFNGSVYILAADQASNSTLSRYEVKNGKMADKAAATAKFTGTNAIVMKFVDENKMYVEHAFGDAITALDPKTLKTTKDISVYEYLDEENGALSSVPCSAVIRDGKLYVALLQLVDFNNMIVSPRGSVAIIDLATDEVEKVIYEDMTASLGFLDDMNNTGSFVDEKGDIYFYSNASLGVADGQKEGFVRIKKGKTEFDKDWVFHLHDAAYDGKKSNSNYLMSGGAYMGNGEFLGFFGNFQNRQNYNNYEWEFVVINLYKKTIKKLDLSPTIPWFAPSIHLDADGKSVVLGHADSKGGAIYRYDIASGKVKKEMDVTTGTAYYIVPVQD
jgi:hypothetical protein